LGLVADPPVTTRIVAPATASRRIAPATMRR
jgi:hypothetical protein